jgi:hypothetical protein
LRRPITSHDLRLKLMPFRTVDVYPGKKPPTYLPITRVEGGVQIKLGEWHVDTMLLKSAFYGTDRQDGPTVSNGNTGDATYPFGSAMYDTPTAVKDPDFKSQTFEAQTYLVMNNQLIYSVLWKMDWTRDKKGEWIKAKPEITKSGQGALGFPPPGIGKDDKTWPLSGIPRSTIPNPFK